MTTHVNQPDCACGLCRAQNSNLADVRSAIALAEAGDVAAVYACAGYTRRMCDEVERLQAAAPRKAPTKEPVTLYARTAVLDGGPTCVDLFSGAGGLAEGFRQAGWRVVAATDVDAGAPLAITVEGL